MGEGRMGKGGMREHKWWEGGNRGGLWKGGKQARGGEKTGWVAWQA